MTSNIQAINSLFKGFMGRYFGSLVTSNTGFKLIWNYVGTEILYRAFTKQAHFDIVIEIVVNDQPQKGVFSAAPAVGAIEFSDENGMMWYIPTTPEQAEINRLVALGVDQEIAKATVKKRIITEAKLLATYGKTWALYGLRVKAVRAGRTLSEVKLDGLADPLSPYPDAEYQRLALPMVYQAVQEGLETLRNLPRFAS